MTKVAGEKKGKKQHKSRPERTDMGVLTRWTGTLRCASLALPGCIGVELLESPDEEDGN